MLSASKTEKTQNVDNIQVIPGLNRMDNNLRKYKRSLELSIDEV